MGKQAQMVFDATDKLLELAGDDKRRKKLAGAACRLLTTLKDFDLLKGLDGISLFGSFLAPDVVPDDVDLVCWYSDGPRRDFQHSYGVDVHFRDINSEADLLWYRSVEQGTRERYGVRPGCLMLWEK